MTEKELLQNMSDTVALNTMLSVHLLFIITDLLPEEQRVTALKKFSEIADTSAMSKGTKKAVTYLNEAYQKHFS